MIISPISILDEIRRGRIIKNLASREIDKPEGVGFDLRLAAIYSIGPGAGALLTTTRRTPASESVPLEGANSFSLKPGKGYLAATIEEFELPEGVAATFVPRSTLFRSGVVFQSSVLPPGYRGPMTFFLMNCHGEDFVIELGARFAHAVLHAVIGGTNEYRGQWQGGRLSQPDDEVQI